MDFFHPILSHARSWNLNQILFLKPLEQSFKTSRFCKTRLAVFSLSFANMRVQLSNAEFQNSY